MSVTKKIEEILSADDLKKFEEGVDRMVADRVEKGIAAKLPIMEAELKAKYDTISEKYVEQKLKAEVEKKTADLVTENDQKLASLEKKVVSRLGSFLDRVVTDSISDDILERIAVNEVALPVLEKIRGVLAESFITVEADGQKKIDEAVTKSSKIERMLSEAIAKNIALEERLEKSAVFLMISERTQGMLPDQKKQVVETFKACTFNEVDEKIDGFVKLVKEAAEPKSTKKIEESVETVVPVPVKKPAPTKKTVDTMIAENDGMPQKKPIVESDDHATQSFSIMDVASTYFDE